MYEFVYIYIWWMVTIFRHRKSKIRRIYETFFYVIILIGCLKDEGYERKVTFNATKNENEHWIVYFYCHCYSTPWLFLLSLLLLLLLFLIQCHSQNQITKKRAHKIKKRHTHFPSISEIMNFSKFLCCCRIDEARFWIFIDLIF